jgi:hypoxanthine phosphoribosyltransferase
MNQDALFGTHIKEAVGIIKDSLKKPEELNVSWDELLTLIDTSANQIKETHPHIDTIVAISRGGLIPASVVSRTLNVKKVYSYGINFYNRENELKKVPDVYQPLPDSFWSSNILVVDDVADSGNSLQHVLMSLKRRFHTDNEPLIYTVFYKPKSIIKPQFYSETVDSGIWINFPWE